MVGKRDKFKRNGSRLPGILVMMLATAAMLSYGDSLDGAAADSPVAALTALPEQIEESTEQNTAEKNAGNENPQSSNAEEAQSEKPEEPSASVVVPVSEPVEDSYFSTAAFLGDSRLEGFTLYSGLKEGSYYFSVGASVESVFTKDVETEEGKMPLLDAMQKKDFKRIYIMLGVNELGWPGTDLFQQQYAKLIQRLQEDHPDSQLILQSVMPVSARQVARGGYVNNERIAAFNKTIRSLAKETGCYYLNAAEAVTDENGCLVKEWTDDGVHLNVQGCRNWLHYMRIHALPDED